MGEEMTILAMIFGATVGAVVMAFFNGHSFNKGIASGWELGYKTGYREGFSTGQQLVEAYETFKDEVPK